MYITKQRFDLLYRVYIAAQVHRKIHGVTPKFENALDALKRHEIIEVTDQLMHGQNNRNCDSTVNT